MGNPCFVRSLRRKPLAVRRKTPATGFPAPRPPDALSAQEDYTKLADYQVPHEAYVNAKWKCPVGISLFDQALVRDSLASTM
jgi:hypothetical protein